MTERKRQEWQGSVIRFTFGERGNKVKNVRREEILPSPDNMQGG
jgi:hypothetical protein